MTKNEFSRLMEKGILFLDGATGSNLIEAGMPRGLCTEKWICENPDILLTLQKAYVEAGSDILYAPTFAANRLTLESHGLENETEQINKTLAALSIKAADGKALVAGDITTTGKFLAPQGDLSYDKLLGIYAEQITYLADSGVDLLVAETMIGIDETLAALDAAASICSLPIMCTLTVESDGSLFTGGSIFEAAAILTEMGADAIGVNCSSGPDQLECIIRNLSAITDLPVIAKPNAGLPQILPDGSAHYNMQADEFADSMKCLKDAGAKILGGCCGTTPEYIRKMKELIKA